MYPSPQPLPPVGQPITHPTGRNTMTDRLLTRANLIRKPVPA